MHTREEKLKAFGETLDVLDTLREKCPWDRKQTNESLRPNTIEEVYELCDALIADDNPNICKELGDVLLHVAFYSKIGEEKGEFDIADVCERLNRKLIFRHPHIYGDVSAETPEQVAGNWEKLKQREKDGNKSVLGGVPAALPALIKANRIQEKARNVGFDWEKKEDVWAKVKEEISEVEAEISRDDTDKARIGEEWTTRNSATCSSPSSTPHASTASTPRTRWSIPTGNLSPASTISSAPSRRAAGHSAT